MSERTLRVGVIGCGRIAQPHLSNLRSSPAASVVAVCDVRPEAAKRAAEPTSAEVFTDPVAMLEAVEMDVVYVLTPTPTHGELGAAVLSSGRHLMVEKPLAANLEDADRLVEAAERSGKVAAVGHQWRYLKGAERAREALNGSPLALVHAWYYWTWPLVGWIAERATGGGQMLDQGIHLLDLARHVAGEVNEATARYTLAARASQGFPNWDAQVLHGRFISGALLDVAVTYALFSQVSEQPTIDFIGNEVLVRVTPKWTEVHRAGETAIFYEAGNPMAELDKAFLSACLADDPLAVRSTVKDARNSLAVVMKANASAREA